MKTDMVYLARGGFWLTIAQMAVSFSSFLLAIAFAHYITKETYGQYKYVLSIISLLGTFSLTRLGSAVLRSVSQKAEGTLEYAFWKNIRWSLPFFLITLSASIYFFIQENSTLGLSLLIAGSLWPFFTSTNLYSSFLIGKKDFRRHAIYYDVIGNLVPSISIFLTMTLTDNPVLLVTAYFASNTIIGIILYRKIVKIYKPNDTVDPEALGYAKHLSAMSILTGIANNIDQIFAFHYIGAAQLAIYNFATAIPNQTKGPIRAISTLMFPKFVERDDREISENMNYKFMTLFILGLVMAIGYILIAPIIYNLFFPNYVDSIFYSQVFAVSLICITFNPAETYLAAKQKTREQYIHSVIIAVLQIATIAIGVIFYGLIGLVVARVTVRILSSLVSFVLYRSVIKRTALN